MKAVIGKSEICNDKFSKSLNINKKEITDIKVIAETPNKFFIKLGFNLADKIPPSSKNSESYLPNIATAFSDKPLSESELNDVFFTWKIKESWL